MSLMLVVTYKPFYAECNYAKCRYGECRYTESRGAVFTIVIITPEVVI